MTCCPYKKTAMRIQGQTEKSSCDNKARDQSYATASQEMSNITSKSPEAKGK